MEIGGHSLLLTPSLQERKRFDPARDMRLMRCMPI